MLAGRVGSLPGRKGSGSRGVYHSSTISYSRGVNDVSDELCTCGPFAVNEAEQRVYCANFGAATCNSWKWLDVEESGRDCASSRRQGQKATTEHGSATPRWLAPLSGSGDGRRRFTGQRDGRRAAEVAEHRALSMRRAL